MNKDVYLKLFEIFNAIPFDCRTQAIIEARTILQQEYDDLFISKQDELDVRVEYLIDLYSSDKDGI